MFDMLCVKGVATTRKDLSENVSDLTYINVY